MTASSIALLSLFFLVSLAQILPVYAEDEIDLADFPANLATQLGIDLFSADILASLIFMSLFLFPTFLFTKSPFAILMIGVGSMSVCVALGWLPVFIVVLMIAMAGGGIAMKAKGILG